MAGSISHPNTLLYIGACNSSRLEDLYAKRPEQMLLVVAPSVRAEELTSATAGRGNIRVLAAAIAAKSGRGELAIMNLPELSSLTEPTPALHALLPGLRIVGREDIAIMDPASLLAALGQVSHPFWLVVDAPGQELELLEGLKAAGAMEQIDRLEFRCGEDVFYEGSASRSEIGAWFEEQRFVLERIDQSDRDWPVLHFRADHSARALEMAEALLMVTEDELQAQLTASEKQVQQAEGRLKELESALSDATGLAEMRGKDLAEAKARLKAAEARLAASEEQVRQVEGRLKELESALADVTGLADARGEALAVAETRLTAAEALEARLAASEEQVRQTEGRLKELESSLVDVTGLADARGKELAAAETRLKASEARLAASEEQVRQTEGRLKELESSLAEVTSLADTRGKDLTAAEKRFQEARERGVDLDKTAQGLRTRNASLTDEVQRTGMDLRRARQDLAVALRQQERLQTELSDLRSRFEVEKTAREEQADLLRQLTSRLREAARQLQTFPPLEEESVPALPKARAQTGRRAKRA